MANFSTYRPDSRYTISTVTNSFGTIHVYNSSVGTASNGGFCCLWTVPAGTTWAKFEVWGGGGAGAGSCCCQQPQQAGASGTYARKTIRVNPGESYTVCAGGTTCCTTVCCGNCGYPSYACGNNSNTGITYPLCLCGSGGYGGCTTCAAALNVGYKTTAQIVGNSCGCDLQMPGHWGGYHEGGSCGYDSWHYVPQGPYIGGGLRISWDHCLVASGTQVLNGTTATFPAGAGGSSITHGGGCCWGGFGAGGLVIISYK